MRRRRDKGMTGEVYDYSLEASSNWDNIRAQQTAKDELEGVHGAHNARAFDDL